MTLYLCYYILYVKFYNTFAYVILCYLIAYIKLCYIMLCYITLYSFLIIFSCSVQVLLHFFIYDFTHYKGYTICIHIDVCTSGMVCIIQYRWYIYIYILSI